jgi:mono/diheme cytochrome c family protein
MLRRNIIKIATITIAITLVAAACSSGETKGYSITDSRAYEATLFRQNCAICHGPEAEGKTLPEGRVIPNLRSGEHKYKTDAAIYDHIANGGDGMVPFRGQLTKREIDLLVSFVQNDLRGGGK